MDTMSAFLMGEMNRGKPLMVFDWNKAARIIKESKTSEAYAGLSGDWEYTGGIIFSNGVPVPEDDTYVYLASTWAKPELETDDGRVYCYIMQDEAGKYGWDAHTYWPESAINILNGSAE
jgi:hypothetical protein